MSGHSKWATIKRKKALEDSKRGQAFTKLIKEITVAARVGGGDPNGNPRLRLLLDKAREINMPVDNATRAIKRGTGELPGVSYEELTYEGYGPHGIAVIVDTLSDNKNRTVSELRHIFTAKGGNLAENGSVSWMFDRSGVIHVPASSTSEEKLLEALIEYDVTDIKREDDTFAIYCNPRALDAVKHAIEKLDIKVTSADLEWVAKNAVALSEHDTEKVYEFLDALEDHEDTKHVFSNLV